MKNYLVMVITIIALSALFGCSDDGSSGSDMGIIEEMHLDSSSDYKHPEIKDSGKISIEEVRKNDDRDSCYTIINEKVYDLTDFIDNSWEYRHDIEDSELTPAEFRTRISTMCGADGTVVFKDLYGSNHMRIDTYYIGELEG